MPGYLDYHFDPDDRDVVAVLDQIHFWSSIFGVHLLRHVPLKPEMRVLDVGCGTGFPSLEIAERLGPGSLVSGIDPWTAGVERARLKAERLGVRNVEIIDGDGSSIPFDNETFDLIVSNVGINNFDEPAAVLAESFRVCKEGGRIALTTNPKGHMEEFYFVLEEVLRDRSDDEAMGRMNEDINHRHTVESIGKMLTTAGFEPGRVEEEKHVMRFASGTAMMNHHLIKIGFMEAWQKVVGEDEPDVIFDELESRLNDAAEANGFLPMTIPVAYIEAVRPRS